MLARRLMGGVRRVSTPPSVANLVAGVGPFVGGPPAMALVVQRGSGSPDVVEIPGVTVVGSIVHGSHEHGTITLWGRSDPGVEPDLGGPGGGINEVSIFPCSASGIPSTPLERLPFLPTIPGTKLLCRDFAVAEDTAASAIKIQSLRTGASRVLVTNASRKLLHAGAAVLVSRSSFGSVQVTPASQGFSRTRANTSSPFRLVVTASISEPDCMRCAAYLGETVVPWELCRSVGDVHVRRTAGLSTGGTTPARRYGSNWQAATVVCSEVHHTTPGAPFTAGGLTLREVTLTIVLSRRRGLMRVYPDGTMAFIPWFEERYEEVGLAWMSGTNMFYKPGLVDWPTLSMPLTTILDLPRPATELAQFWPLADRLVSGASGIVRGWSYDGVHLGDHAYSGTLRGSIGGENVLVTSLNQYSRNAGATWSAVDAGATIVVPGEVQTLRKF